MVRSPDHSVSTASEPSSPDGIRVYHKGGEAGLWLPAPKEEQKETCATVYVCFFYSVQSS